MPDADVFGGEPGIAKIKLSQLYLFEENDKLECDFCSSKIKIHFPIYMLPLPRKI